MKLFDIHSHLLPNVDDGPIDVETSLKLLDMMKKQGITDVIATPHFIATRENLEEYILRVNSAYTFLREKCADGDYPNVFLGSEVFYFSGIGKSRNIRHLALCGSDYILLELPLCSINHRILEDITEMSENLGLIPIIAHIERYAHQKGFKDLLRLVSQGIALAQVNCASLIEPHYKKTVIKLINKGFISFLATDTHSPIGRPPLMDKALLEIEAKIGTDSKKAFIRNSIELYNEIAQENQFAI